MRIVCPSCAAAYEVPDARLLPGQPVRCARCGTNWSPVAESPPAAKPVQPPAASPLPPPPSRPAASDAQIFSSPSPLVAADPGKIGAAGGPAVLAGWVLSVAVILGVGWAAVTFRYDVMHAWPPSERLYSTLGLLAER